MGYWIVRQPNGLYARFSTVVDNFVVTNATREEIVQHMIKMPYSLGKDAAQCAVDEADNEASPGDGEHLSRWKHALASASSRGMRRMALAILRASDTSLNFDRNPKSNAFVNEETEDAVDALLEEIAWAYLDAVYID